MVAIPVPIGYGNLQGGYSLTQRDWDGRIPAQVALILGMGVDIFAPIELHEEKGSGLPNGGHKYFLAKLQAADADWAMKEGNGGNQLLYRPSKFTVPAVVNKTMTTGRSMSDFTVQHTASGFKFHLINAHFWANDNNGRDRTSERKQNAKYLLNYAKKLGFVVVTVDMNSSTEASGYPRDQFQKGGFLGLRQRGEVTNGGRSTRSNKTSESFWIEDIWTRKAQSVDASALVLTNGASDHNGWLRTTVTFDDGIAAPPPKVVAKPLPIARARLPYSSPSILDPVDRNRPWQARVRYPDLTLGPPVGYSSATLVENYNAPNMLSMSGRTDRIGDARLPGYGIVVTDDQGSQRFSGVLTSTEKTGAGNANLIFVGDMVRMWWRICYPVPAAEWTTAGQSVAYDVQAGDAETKLLTYIINNAGTGALDSREFPGLRVAGSAGRGPVGTTSARFDILGQLVATLAESADLRVTVEQTWEGRTPYLDVKVTDAPDLSAWAGFGTPESGGPWMLSPEWRYKLDLPVTTVALAAAGGEGAARMLASQSDQDAVNTWGARIETLVDQRDTTDATEIANGLADALTSGRGTSEISVPILSSEDIGGLIPLGAMVTVTLDGEPIVERIRQITTVVNPDPSAKTMTISAVIGSPDAGVQSPTQKVLAAMLRRVQNLEKR